MAERLILVGRVAGAFGVRGEIRITPYTAEPAALLDYRELQREDGSPALTLTSGRVSGDGVIARAQEVATREEAQSLKGLGLFIPRSRLPEPEEDEFYLVDLIGLAAVAPDGTPLGRVKSVQNFGAGELVEIEPPGGATWYAPFTMADVPEIRLADGVVVVVRPEEG
ncbi:MAG TPA: ribosome maturation factor RimM [Caulobacteraceae bacterium]